MQQIAQVHAKKILTVDEMLQHIERKQTSFFISFGICRSSKRITFDRSKNRITVEHYIDNTTEHVPLKKLGDHNIGVAIKAGNFYLAL